MIKTMSPNAVMQALGRSGWMMAEHHANVRARFWVESVLTLLASALFVLAVVWPDWLEAFGLAPDGGNGFVELMAAAALATCSVAFAVAARVEWRRAAVASG